MDLLAQPYGRGDLEDAGDEGPGRDQIEQHERRDPRPEECQEPHGDAGHTLQQQRPPGHALRPADQRRDDGEDAVRQGKGSIEKDQRPQGDARPGEGHDPEKNGEEAPQRQGPPVARAR